MKKTFVTMITGLLCTSLLACGNVNSDKTTTKEEVPVSQFDLQENDEQKEQKKSAEAKDYLAQKESGLSIVGDYDTCIGICVDALQEFYHGLKHPETVDLSPYITNSNLNEYITYSLNHYMEYCLDGDWRFYLTSFELLNDGQKDFACVKGIPIFGDGAGSTSYCGEKTFVLSNESGRIVIQDWVDANKDKVDERFRNNYNVTENLDFWNNPEKYQKIMDAIRTAAQPSDKESEQNNEDEWSVDVEQVKQYILEHYEETDLKKGDIVIDSVLTGSFSAENTEEKLIICSILNRPHVAGLDTKVGVVQDTNTSEYIAYKEFHCDKCSVYTFKNANGVMLILSATSAINQGIETQSINLYKIADGEYKKVPIPFIDELKKTNMSYFYFVTQDSIIVSQVNDMNMVDEVSAILRWNPESNEFEYNKG